MTTEKVKYGVHSEAGKLHKVMVCSPGLAHQRLTPSNCDELLFDDVLWVNQAKRDHFDFVTKMRDRGIDVLEMHNLLTDIVAIPEALDWILDHKVTPNQVGVGLVNEVKSWLKSLEPRQIAEYLIGGVSADDLPDSFGGKTIQMFRDFLGHTSFIGSQLNSGVIDRLNSHSPPRTAEAFTEFQSGILAIDFPSLFHRLLGFFLLFSDARIVNYL